MIVLLHSWARPFFVTDFLSRPLNETIFQLWVGRGDSLKRHAAKNNNDKGKSRFNAKSAKLDLLIYRSHKAKTIRGWIKKYSPKKEHPKRLDLFGPSLRYRLPGMMKVGNSLLVYNQIDHKVEKFEVIGGPLRDYLFLNGKDISKGLYETSDQWLKRVFQLKSKSAQILPLKYILPKAYAAKPTGYYLNAIVAQAFNDVTADINKSSLKKGPHRQAQLKSMPADYIKNMNAVTKARQEMRDLLVSQIYQNSDVKCVSQPDKKYYGAQMTTDIEGQNVLLNSRPTDAETAYKLGLINQPSQEKTAELVFNQWSGEYTVTYSKNGSKKIDQGNTRLNSGQQRSSGKIKTKANRHLNEFIAPLASSYISSPSLRPKKVKMSSEDYKRLRNLFINKKPELGYAYTMCRAKTADWGDNDPAMGLGIHTWQIDYTKAVKRFGKEKINATYSTFNTDVRDGSICSKHPAFLKSLKEARTERDRLLKAYKGRTRARFFYTDQWKANTKLKEELDLAIAKFNTLKKTLNQINSLASQKQIQGFCRRLESVTKSKDFFPKRFKGEPCDWFLFEKVADQDMKLYDSITATLGKQADHNKKVQEEEKTYMAKLTTFGTQLDVIEAATACCRIDSCREAMEDTRQIIDRKKALRNRKQSGKK